MSGTIPSKQIRDQGKGAVVMIRRLLNASEASEDLAHGQIVIVAARWMLVAAGLLLALWMPGPIGELRVQVLVLLLIAVANFYLHAQLLRRRPTLDAIAYGASAADIAVITTLVVTQGGFESNLYTFYFPAVLALSVAFPVAITALFTGAIVVLYALIGLVSIGASPAAEDLQVLTVRLLMLAGVAVCGGLYWHIEGGRRSAAAEAQQQFVAQLRERDSTTVA